MAHVTSARIIKAESEPHKPVYGLAELILTDADGIEFRLMMDSGKAEDMAEAFREQQS